MQKIFVAYWESQAEVRRVVSELRVMLGGSRGSPTFTKGVRGAEIVFYDSDGRYPTLDGGTFAQSGGVKLAVGSDSFEVLFPPRHDAHAPMFRRGHVRQELDGDEAAAFLAHLVSGFKAAMEDDARRTLEAVAVLAEATA